MTDSEFEEAMSNWFVEFQVVRVGGGSTFYTASLLLPLESVYHFLNMYENLYLH